MTSVLASKPAASRPGFLISLGVTIVAVAIFGWLRLIVFPDRLVPLAYSLPLLLCLWNRDLRLMYGMAVVFSGFAAFKSLFLLPESVGGGGYDWLILSMHMANIWVVAGVLHGLLWVLGRLEQQNQALARMNVSLQEANEELTTTNEALAAREEKIAQQNELLVSQAAELEQQAEELRQQTEELEQQTEELRQQSEELHAANEELLRRDRGMQTMLESGRWLRSDLEEQLVMNAICQAAVQVMGEEVQAAAIVQEKEGSLDILGHWGFGINGATQRSLEFSRSFTSVALERGQTAFVEDVQTRPDLELPQPVAGRPFRSVLTSPIWIEGRPVATLETYSHQPRPWTQGQFHVIEWLAAQCALALQAARAQQQLELKRRDAEEASVQKTRFLAAVSHDVRTPANAISLLADLIDQSARDPEQVGEVPELAQDLKKSAALLIELVSDVLDLARFDAGRMDLQITQFSLNSVVQSEVKQAQPMAQEKGLRLECCMCEPEIWIRSDRLKLARVLSNLIGNALKFTQYGGIRVFCERLPDGTVELGIADTGVGIPAEHLPRIFDEFFQLRNPERDRDKGTGLGLAICRRLVEGLGCAVTARSTLGEGSTFLLHIPAELVVPDLHVVPKPQPADGAGGELSIKGLRILLVEDHDITRQVVTNLLRSRGAVVAEASTGRQAMQLLEESHPEVLLLDLMLPDIDGREILRALQVERPPPLRCVLAVSGDVRDARKEEVRRLGADDLVPKPLSIQHLLAVMQRHLDRSREAADKGAATRESAPKRSASLPA